MFRVGDIVEIVKNSTHGWSKGTICEVSKVRKNGMSLLKVGGSLTMTMFHWNDDVVPTDVNVREWKKDKKKELTAKFNVGRYKEGDEVVITFNSTGGFFVGTECVIKKTPATADNGNGKHFVLYKVGHKKNTMWHPESDFKLNNIQPPLFEEVACSRD